MWTMKTCDLVYSITIQGTFPKISRVLSQNYIGTLIDIKEKCLNIITCTDVSKYKFSKKVLG